VDHDAPGEQPVDKIQQRDVAVAKRPRDPALLSLARCLPARSPGLAFTFAAALGLWAVGTHRAESIELLTKL
jgi:hypothetical protein